MNVTDQNLASAAGGSYLLEISDKEFQLMRELIYQRVGINLTEQKRSLLVGRLQKVLKTTGHTNFRDYYEYLISDTSERAISQLVDNISTNHTFFNREEAHFDFFKHTALPEVVQRLKASRDKDLRIWCAGCSSGEEAYMILMLLHEYFGSEYNSWDAGILATDISERALAAARSGIYSPERMSTLPEALKRKYFRRLGDGRWQVSNELRKEATFRRFNLMNATFPFKKQFHIIFCRNVMIYFDQPTRETLVSKFAQFCVPGGHLFIGHSETLGRNQSLFRYVQPAVFQRSVL